MNFGYNNGVFGEMMHWEDEDTTVRLLVIHNA